MARDIQRWSSGLEELCAKLKGRITVTMHALEETSCCCAAICSDGGVEGLPDTAVIMLELKRKCLLNIMYIGHELEFDGAVCENVLNTKAHRCV